MAKVSTNLNIDAELKKNCQELFADLGMDFTTAVTIFLKQSLRVQGLPFSVVRDVPASRPEAISGNSAGTNAGGTNSANTGINTSGASGNGAGRNATDNNTTNR